MKMDGYVREGELSKAREIQYAVNEVIYKMCAAKGNLYGVIKGVLKINEGLELGGVRAPLPALSNTDLQLVEEAAGMIRAAKERFLG